MFKVLLIIYVVGGGGSKGIDDTWNIGFEFQEFYSMTDCETVKEKMETMVEPWHRGKNDNKIKAHYSAECVPMTAVSSHVRNIQPVEVDVDGEVEVVVEPEPIPRRTHKRWDSWD